VSLWAWKRRRFSQTGFTMKSCRPFRHRYMITFRWMIFFALARLSAPAAEIGSSGNAALVLVAAVSGKAVMVADGKTTPLVRDAKVAVNALVKTAADASAVLLFSNGIQLHLGAKSELVVDEFLQEPFLHAVKVDGMTNEPSVSKTKLRFIRGDVLMQAVRLNLPGGSSFAVQTPGGTLGIRGTKFRLLYEPPARSAKKDSMLLEVLEGNVTVQPQTGPSTSVGTGQSMSLPVSGTIAASAK
jgi:hypothetical protein